MEVRTFIPGSEWIYFKVYTGTKTADLILKNGIFRFVREMTSNDIIDKWFFIRYNDPDFHIRLRLHQKDIRKFDCILKHFFEIFNPLVNDGFIWNIQCDTYKREMERYGINTISLVEEIFFRDSEHIIPLLQRLDRDKSEQQQWNLALVLIDSFLCAFSLELPQRRELLITMADNYKKEFGFIHKGITKQLNDKFRFFRKDIEKAMVWENETIEIINIIKDRSQSIVPIAEKLTDMEKNGEIQIPIKILLTNLIHMTMNRWFRTKNRLHEMVIYEFLSRYYSSAIAKNNNFHG